MVQGLLASGHPGEMAFAGAGIPGQGRFSLAITEWRAAGDRAQS
jgi:hypothetical protein